MTGNEEIRQEILSAIAGVAGPVAITAESRLTRDLGLDSLAVMNFVLSIEERLDLSIPLDRMAEIETVGDLTQAIIDLKNESEPT